VFLLPAGKQDADYTNRVNSFDWQRLFYRSPQLFSTLAESLSKDYDFVLIDSRTGETDVGGICTAILPDTLVTVFTPNQQSTQGLRSTIESAISFRSESADLRPLVVVPLPSRVDGTYLLNLTAINQLICPNISNTFKLTTRLNTRLERISQHLPKHRQMYCPKMLDTKHYLMIC